MISDQIFQIAGAIAKSTPDFLKPLGPGKNGGDGRTQKFLENLNVATEKEFSKRCEQQVPVITSADFTFDYYIPEEKTVIEVALTLHNALSEFEKDIFKCILSNEAGRIIKKLVFIGKKGANKRLSRPGSKAICNFAQNRFGIEIVVKEIGE